MVSVKGSNHIQLKIKGLIEVLPGAEENANVHQRKAFYSSLNEVQEVLSLIEYQVDRYLGLNALKRKIQASDVRNKLKTLMHNVSFYTCLLDSVYGSTSLVGQVREIGLTESGAN